MEIYFLRHGDAETALFNTPEEDFERQLTRMGEDALVLEALGMKKFIKSLDVILTSTATRAVQTAQIFGKVLGCSNIVKTEALRPPCNVPDLLEAIAVQEGVERVMCVGHTPALGELASEMITGIEEEDFFGFRKGGLLRMDIDRPVPRADARLVYFLDPDLPKMLGELLSGARQHDDMGMTDIDPEEDIEPPTPREEQSRRPGIRERSRMQRQQEEEEMEEEEYEPPSRHEDSRPTNHLPPAPDDLDFEDEEEDESGPFHIEV